VKNRTVYKLVKKEGEEKRVSSKKTALAKYNSSDYHAGNPYTGVIRQRQEKSADGFFFTKKTTVLRDRNGMVADKYRTKAEDSSMEFEVSN